MRPPSNRKPSSATVSASASRPAPEAAATTTGRAAGSKEPARNESPSNLDPDITIRYHLDDPNGGDLAYLDIKGGTIVGAGISSTVERLYVGQLSYDFYANKRLRVGDYIRFSRSPNHPIEKFRYPIERMEVLAEAR